MQMQWWTSKDDQVKAIRTLEKLHTEALANVELAVAGIDYDKARECRDIEFALKLATAALRSI